MQDVHVLRCRERDARQRPDRIRSTNQADAIYRDIEHPDRAEIVDGAASFVKPPLPHPSWQARCGLRADGSMTTPGSTIKAQPRQAVASVLMQLPANPGTHRVCLRVVARGGGLPAPGLSSGRRAHRVLGDEVKTTPHCPGGKCSSEVKVEKHV
jgi:hypothetical protein